jgi:hypothetical protein
MANSYLLVNGFPSGNSLYATIKRDSDEYVYRTDTKVYEIYNSANIANYAINLVESSPTYYVGSIPTEAQTESILNVSYFKKVGTNPNDVVDISIGGDTITITSFLQSAGDILSLAEYKVIVPDTGSEDSRLQFLITAASNRIRREINFNYAITLTEDYALDGNGYYLLQLRSLPIANTLQVTVNDVLSTAEFGITDRGEIYYKDGGFFPTGIQNIEVEYTSVSTDIPKDLKLACAKYVQIMEWYISGDAELSSQSLDKFSQTWDLEFVLPGDAMSGIYADLQPFKRWSVL